MIDSLIGMHVLPPLGGYYTQHMRLYENPTKNNDNLPKKPRVLNLIQSVTSKLIINVCIKYVYLRSLGDNSMPLPPSDQTDTPPGS